MQVIPWWPGLVLCGTQHCGWRQCDLHGLSQHFSCLSMCSYAPYRLDTDARVSDAISLNQTASE